MTMNYIQIPPQHLNNYWAVIKPAIQSILDEINKDIKQEFWLPEDVFASIKAGQSILFWGDDSFVVMQKRMDQYSPNAKAFVWIAYSFEPSKNVMETCLPEVKEIAKTWDCQFLEFSTIRKGFSKAAINLGYSAGPCTNADPWSGVQPYLKNVYNQANALGQTPVQYYPGQTYANMDALKKQGIQSNVAYASNQLPRLYGQTAQSLYDQMNAMNVANNPYVQDMNRAASAQFVNSSNQALQGMADQFRQTVIPGITNDAVAAGGLGGSRQGVAQGIAASQLAGQMGNVIKSGQSDLANMLAQTNLGAWGQGLSAANNALGQAGNVANLGLMPGQIMQQGGDIFEQYRQKAIDSAMQKWDFQQNEPWQRLSNLNAIFSGATPYAQQSSTTTQPAPTSSPWATAAAGASALGGLFF